MILYDACYGVGMCLVCTCLWRVHSVEPAVQGLDQTRLSMAKDQAVQNRTAGCGGGQIHPLFEDVWKTSWSICPKHACHINIGRVLKCYQRISAWFYLYRLYLLLVWSWRESLPRWMHEQVEFTRVRNASPAVHCSSSSWSPGAMKRADAHSLATCVTGFRPSQLLTTNLSWFVCSSLFHQLWTSEQPYPIFQVWGFLDDLSHNPLRVLQLQHLNPMPGFTLSLPQPTCLMLRRLPICWDETLLGKFGVLAASLGCKSSKWGYPGPWANILWHNDSRSSKWAMRNKSR